jgi:hypothetical protein
METCAERGGGRRGRGAWWRDGISKAVPQDRSSTSPLSRPPDPRPVPIADIHMEGVSAD